MLVLFTVASHQWSATKRNSGNDRRTNIVIQRQCPGRRGKGQEGTGWGGTDERRLVDIEKRLDLKARAGRVRG